MVMDEEMEDTVEGGFLPLEIDLDYEFDVPRYFDFCRRESPLEAQEAELWFESAGSYPPSPVIVKLNLREDILVENVNTSPKSKDVEKTDSITNDSNIDMGPEFSTTDENNRDHEGMDGGVFINLPIGYLQKDENEPQALGTGLTFYNHMAQDIPKAKSKTAMKARGSTLMKPTASQLAKQNRPREDLYSGQYLERFQKPLVQNKERSVENPSGIESQAAKRQKLEGGHLRKVTDLKQQTNLVHKVPKKSEPVYGNSHAKLKLTIPREPELETAYRAQMARHKNNTELGQHVKSTASTFKAHPLNRKIFEAPSLPLSQKSRPQFPEFQVFHLKKLERATQHSTAASSSPLYCNNSDKVFHLKKLERATQHSTAASSSPLYCNNSDKMVHKPNSHSTTQNGMTESKRPNFIDAPKQEGCEIMQRFKARPLNKKIFSSKGDIGVFRNIKREVTVPMEFNFPTDKRFQPNPPIELFTKLSLTSDLLPNTISQPKVPQPSCIPTKGSKENTLGHFQEEHVLMHVVKEKPQRYRGKAFQCGSDWGITEIGPRANMSR